MELVDLQKQIAVKFNYYANSLQTHKKTVDILTSSDYFWEAAQQCNVTICRMTQVITAEKSITFSPVTYLLSVSLSVCSRFVC